MSRPAFAEALSRVLEESPDQFAAVAHQVNLLPSLARARDYSEAEIGQLNNGMVHMLLEDLREEPAHFRKMFMDMAIPSFVREGETPERLLRWNAAYLVVLGAALSATLEPEQRAACLGWFAAFAATHLSEVVDAATRATAALTEDQP